MADPFCVNAVFRGEKQTFPDNKHELLWIGCWEWTTDWFQEHGKISHSCCGNLNPQAENATRAMIRTHPM